MRKLLFALMAVAVCLTSCNEIEKVDCPTCDGGVEEMPDNVLVIHPFIEGKNMMTRNWRDGNTLGLWLTEGHVTKPYQSDAAAYSNVKAKFYSDTWFTQCDVMLTSDPAYVYACSPFLVDSDPEAIPVECQSGTDYMYGTHVKNQRNVYAGHNEALLMMKHALSLVQVYIAKSADTPSISVQSIELRPVTEQGFPIAGSLNIETETLTHTAWGKYSQKVSNWTLEDGFTENGRRDLPVIPQRIEANQVELAVNIGGVEYTKMLPSNHWERAYRYVYRILFNGEKLNLVNVEIAPWETAGDIIIDIVG